MPRVNVAATPAKAPAGITRKDLTPGDIFYRIIGGARGDNRYGHVAINGKFLSINLETGNLASTVNGDAPVEVVGKFSYEMHVKADQNDAMRRSELSTDAIFHANGGKTLYLNMGGFNDGEEKFLSVPAGKPLSDDFATTLNGRGSVAQVGTYSIKAVI